MAPCLWGTRTAVARWTRVLREFRVGETKVGRKRTYDYVVACIKDLPERLREFGEEDASVLLGDGAVGFVEREGFRFGEDD